MPDYDAGAQRCNPWRQVWNCPNGGVIKLSPKQWIRLPMQTNTRARIARAVAFVAPFLPLLLGLAGTALHPGA